jgi:hypothetical protein
VLVIETIEVFVVPFNEVSEQFAFEQGEGDRSLAYWRKAHENYFRRNDFKDRVFGERTRTSRMVVENGAEPGSKWKALGKASNSFYHSAGKDYKFDGTSGESNRFA